MTAPQDGEQTETPTQFAIRMMAALGETFPSVVLASTLPSAIRFAKDDYASLSTELVRVRGALKKYGQHVGPCAVVYGPFGKGCTCGLAAALGGLVPPDASPRKE